MAIFYQMKDELKPSPSVSQFLVSAAFIPWSVKPMIHGILSDYVPIGGSRRVPHLIIAVVLSFVPWFVLAHFVALRASSFAYLTVLLITTQNVGAAMADIVMDAIVAETAAHKERFEFTGALQAISWLATVCGAIVGSVSAGLGGLSVLNVEGIFLIFSILPLLQLVACGLMDKRMLGQVAFRIEDDANERILECPTRYGLDVVTEVERDSSLVSSNYAIIVCTKEEAFSTTTELNLSDKDVYIVCTEIHVTHTLEVRESNERLKTEIVREGCESSLIEEDEEDWIQIESNGLEKESMIIEFPSPNLAVITNRTGSAKFNINEQMEKLKLVETNPMVSDIPDSDPKHVNNYVLLSHQPLALQ
ncbi:unnamed protein product [Sphagnum compactum]